MGQSCAVPIEACSDEANIGNDDKPVAIGRTLAPHHYGAGVASFATPCVTPCEPNSDVIVPAEIFENLDVEELGPGTAFKLRERIFEDRQLCCGMSWEAGESDPLEPFCVLFDSQGLRLGELHTHLAPFARNKIRYAKSFPQSNTAGVCKDKIYFRICDFEANLSVICFAFRKVHSTKSTGSRYVRAVLLDATGDHDRPICSVSVAIPGSAEMVLVATLTRGDGEEEWHFESIGLCLPLSLLDEWIRRPWAFDEDSVASGNFFKIANECHPDASEIEITPDGEIRFCRSTSQLQDESNDRLSRRKHFNDDVQHFLAHRWDMTNSQKSQSLSRLQSESMILNGLPQPGLRVGSAPDRTIALSESLFRSSTSTAPGQGISSSNIAQPFQISEIQKNSVQKISNIPDTE